VEEVRDELFQQFVRSPEVVEIDTAKCLHHRSSHWAKAPVLMRLIIEQTYPISRPIRSL